jgi:hypothetical protein
LSTRTPVVLSPDLTQYWDGTAWLPALLSPDGKQVWTGSEWLPVASGAGDGLGQGSRPRSLTDTRAYVAACAMCGSAATLVMLIGAVLPEGPKKLVEVVATLPILLIHTAADSFKEGRLVLSSPAALLARLRRPAWATGSGLQSGPWWVTGAVLGALLAVFDNVVVVFVVTMLGPLALLALVLPLGAAVGLGVFVSRTSGRRGVAVVAVMAYVAALGNSVVGAVLQQRFIIVLFGLVFGGTLLLGLGLAGFFGDRLLRATGARQSLTESAPPPEPAWESPVQVVLTEEGRIYWDGTEWRPVVQMSDDGHHAWNGREWLAVAPSHPAQPPA